MGSQMGLTHHVPEAAQLDSSLWARASAWGTGAPFVQLLPVTGLVDSQLARVPLVLRKTG